MHSRSLLTVSVLGALTACYGPPDMPLKEALPHPEAAELQFQAVDAGTGAALEDPELTVRYLVRSPIILNDAKVEKVTSIEPYDIREVIQEDALVLEVRLEASSYHPLDTVLSVARGASAGPLTMRMSRRLDLASTEPPSSGREPVAPPVSRPAPGGGRGTLPPVPRGPDRTALLAGNRAFARGNWLEATEAYARMPLPDDPNSPYGREYQQALLRRGVAHMNRGEYDGALEVLQSAASYGTPGFQTFLRLASAQCAVGRPEEGRATLAQLERGLNRRSQNDQLLVGALIQYERGMCSAGEFDRAETTRERVRTGSAAIQDLQGFIDFGERIEPVPAAVASGIDDARDRIELIRRRMSGN